MTPNYNLTVTNPAEIEAFSRPLIRDGKVRVYSGPGQANGQIYVQNAAGIQVLSSLRKDEWEQLDAAVQRAARLSRVALPDLRSAGLVRPVDMGTVISQWNTASEVTPAEESITGEGSGEQAQVDFDLSGIPVPVIFKGFRINRRMLLASRKGGDGLDTITAFEATQAVVEKRENTIFNGSAVSLNGNSLYGYTTHPTRLTDTVGNYGGGDWGTGSNIVPTITGMIAAASAQRFHGPFTVYVAPTQYRQAANAFPSSDNDRTYIDRLRALEQVADVKRADFLADGVIVMVQMTENVVDYVEASDVAVVEWASGDGMTSHFKVMAVGAPRIKDTHAGRIGLVHATGA